MNKRFLSSETVYNDLCEKIEKLIYMPGQGISENELCSVYGVSRHIIRSAITRLKERHLITVLPQRGTFVSLIDTGYVEDILFIRESVEQESLARAFNLEEEKKNYLIIKMKELLSQQNNIFCQEDSQDEFYEMDNRFHEAVLEAIGKKNVMEIIHEQYIHVRRWRNFEVRSKERMKEILFEHKSILECLEKGEKEKGKLVLNHHLNTVPRLREIYKRTQPEYFVFS